MRINSTRYLFILLSFAVSSCSPEETSFPYDKALRRIDNPYSGIDFQTASRVKAITHEHISNRDQVKTAYDRGIRYFACVNYFPACPSYPLSNWSYEYQDYVSPSDLRLETFVTSGSIVSFVDQAGNVVLTDSLVQLPNAEHAFYSNTSNLHFNVLGSVFGECTNGTRKKGEWSEESLGMKRNKWYSLHPKWDIKDINSQYLNNSNQLFPGKVFGTINHTYNEKAVRKMLEECPDVFKAIEIVNQGSTESDCRRFRDLWDTLLSEGKRIWGTSVIDWQSLGPDGKPRLGACNVLMINDYDNQTILKKSELGLDAFISGTYFPAGLANYEVLDFSADTNSIRIRVSGKPSEIVIVTNRGRHAIKGKDFVEYQIEDRVTYIRFEVWYKDSSGRILDYLFTNPVFVEYQI